jgi:putative nucleotidyltransferase with HDIG domain
MLTRSQALDLINGNVTKRNVVFHMLAVEAIMRSIARFLGDDEDQWGLVGLLHDVDYEMTETAPERHGLLSEQMLKGLVSDDIIRAIKTHNSAHTGVAPASIMEKALIASDAVSGLLIACALVMPSKMLAEVKVESVAKKFRDKDFARGADRDRIMVCEQIGIPRDKFFEIALNGLKASAEEIGL